VASTKSVPSSRSAVVKGTVTLATGDLIAGKYRVEHPIAQGGMGIVVAARHVPLGHLVTVKVLLDRLRA
jgi:serine/threonine-protein kinase